MGVAADGANTTAVFSGIDPESGARYLYLETLGAGGYGPPSEWTPERLVDDRESGKFSAKYMRRNFVS